MKFRTLRFLSSMLLAVLTLAIACAAAGSFTATGSMEFARRRHTATRLANGRVLIAGGANGTGTLATAELFNPATGTFTRIGNMRSARVGHKATLLANGKVLVTEGQTRQELLRRQNFSTPPPVLSRALAIWQLHGLGTRQPYCLTARCSWREVEPQKRSFSTRAPACLLLQSP